MVAFSGPHVKSKMEDGMTVLSGGGEFLPPHLISSLACRGGHVPPHVLLFVIVAIVV